MSPSFTKYTIYIQLKYFIFEYAYLKKKSNGNSVDLSHKEKNQKMVTTLF